MRKEIGTILSGLGIGIGILFLEKQAETMPQSVAILGYVVAVILIVFGVYLSLRKTKPEMGSQKTTIRAKVVSKNQQDGQTADTIYNIGTKEEPDDKEA